ncbi:MAG: hypothetical protein MZV49_16870 [Rhodopseudomonas palustris]|nr:hypothetical protein [Rhodopseudomonas palustris]
MLIKAPFVVIAPGAGLPKISAPVRAGHGAPLRHVRRQCRGGARHRR